MSQWPCTIEEEADGSLSMRMGLGYAKGLRKESAEAITAALGTRTEGSGLPRISPCVCLP